MNEMYQYRTDTLKELLENLSASSVLDVKTLHGPRE